MWVFVRPFRAGWLIRDCPRALPWATLGRTFAAQCKRVEMLSVECCVGCRVSGVGCRVSGVGCRVSGVGCRVSGVGCRVSGVGCRVSGVGCRVSGE